MTTEPALVLVAPGTSTQVHRTVAPLRTALPPRPPIAALLDALERAIVRRERHQQLGERVDNIAGFAPALAMMTNAIDAAKAAIAAHDVAAMIAIYAELRSFEDD